MAKARYDVAKAPAPAMSAETRSGQAIAFAQEKAAALQKRGSEAAASLQKKGSETGVALKEGAVEFARVAKVKSEEFATVAKVKSETLAKDRRVQVTAASAAVGGATVGAGGAAVGLVTGGAVGAACGVPFALFTFGLSIPVSAMIGGGLGAVTGGTVGTTVGATTGGAVGFGAFTKRAEIKAGIQKGKEVALYFYAKAFAKAKDVKKQVFVRIGSIRDMVQKKMGGSQARTPPSSATYSNRSPSRY